MYTNYKYEWKNLLNLTNDLLIKIKKKGIQAEIKININNGISTIIKTGKINILKYIDNKNLSINIYKNNSKSIISTSDFSKKTLLNIINVGINITNFTKKNKYLELPNNSFKNINYNLNIYHPCNDVLQKIIKYNTQNKKILFLYDKTIINSENYIFLSNNNFKIYGNTNGFIGSYPSSIYSWYNTIVFSNKGIIKNNYKHIKFRNINDLLNMKYIENLSSINVIKKLKIYKIKTTTQPVILISNIASIFLNNFIEAIYGYNIYNKKSFLSNSLNKKIFPNNVIIYEDPHIINSIGSKPFDNDGINTKFKIIVNNGYLKNYLLDTYYAKKLNMNSTGNSGGISNIIISNDNISFKNLIKKMYKGLLITELMENEVNIITGDYSYEIFGYFINKGEIEYPVNKIIISGNLKEIFLNIINISNDIYNYEKIKTGSILINNVYTKKM
ncbi:MAG: hypothetical protein HYZ30_00570 [Candidatus Azosocius agrarius]|nr:MAG: hypothetical protein HYZ30_00570 [Gammaproteobacteria bacterium]